MFLALDLPEDARDRLADWRDEILDGRRDLRPVRPEALHVTLVFLGWQDESAAERIAEAAFEALPAGPLPRLAATGVRPVPPKRARLFALDLDDEGGRATALQAAISDALEAGGWYRPGEASLLAAHHARPGQARERRVAPPPDQPAPPAEAFDAGVVTLYRSTLRPQGALYEPLARTVASDALDPASPPSAD